MSRRTPLALSWHNYSVWERLAAIFRVERLMGVQRVGLGSRTSRLGEGGQITVEGTQFDEKGNPMVVVADCEVGLGETYGWLAVARLAVPPGERKG